MQDYTIHVLFRREVLLRRLPDLEELVAAVEVEIALVEDHHTQAAGHAFAESTRQHLAVPEFADD